MTDTPETPPGDNEQDDGRGRTLEQLLDLGVSLRAQLEAGLSKKWDCLERPYALAGMMSTSRQDPMDLRTHAFETMVNAFMAMQIGPLVEPYVKLHDDLVAHAHVDSKSKFEFGNDAYVWAIAERFAEKRDFGFNFQRMFGDGYEPEPPDPKARRTKAIVLQTQSCSFLVVMNYEFGCWARMDVREFWPDVRDELAEADSYLLNLNELRDRKDLTVLDLVRYSTQAATYSDDLREPGDEGYCRIERPSLATLLNGTLWPGEDSAGPALRFGDFRDAGFVVSVRIDRERGPETEKLVHTRISPINYVAHNMSSAIYVMSEEYPATPDVADTPDTSGIPGN